MKLNLPSDRYSLISGAIASASSGARCGRDPAASAPHTEGNAEGVVGGKPEASRPSAPRTDSPAGPDPGRPSDRSHSDTASFPYKAATVELLRAGLADAEQRRIPVHRGTTAACAETTGAARSQRQP